MTLKNKIAHVSYITDAFGKAMDLAESRSSDDNEAVKWSIVACIDRLRSEGWDNKESLTLLQECVDDVVDFVSKLDNEPPHLTVVN